MCGGWIIPSVHGYQDVYCENRYTSSSSGTCVLQAYNLVASRLTATFWWLSIAVNGYAGLFGGALIKKINRCLTGFPILLS